MLTSLNPFSFRQFCALLALSWLPVALTAAPSADPARFEKTIAAYEADDKTTPPPKDATLFYGASNIRLWKSLPQRFGKQKVINRGFGGSQLSDCIHFADRVVIPYAPKTIYLNAKTMYLETKAKITYQETYEKTKYTGTNAKCHTLRSLQRRHTGKPMQRRLTRKPMQRRHNIPGVTNARPGDPS